MDYRPRVSRQDRKRGGLPLRGIAIAFILLALGVLVFFRSQIPKPQSKPVPVVANKPTPPANLTAIADSLILDCCRSFGLTDSILKDSTLSQFSGPIFHRFRQGWPAELPFLAFAQRLSGMASVKNLQCDCQESSKQGWLDCVLKTGQINGAKVILDSGRNTNLAGRELVIVFDHLGGMKKDDIIKLIRSGVVFSYFGTDGFYPTGDLAKLFSRGNITSILEISADNAGLKKLGQTSRSAKTEGKKKGSKSVDKSLSSGMLSCHPGAKAITFSSGNDPVAIKAALDIARRAKLSYLCMNEELGMPDQLALESKIGVLSLILQKSDKTLAQFKFDLISQLLSKDSPHQIAFCLDASKTDPDELIAFKIMLDRIGVKFKPFMKLAKKVEAS
jgi:hypothetical protein